MKRVVFDAVGVAFFVVLFSYGPVLVTDLRAAGEVRSCPLRHITVDTIRPDISGHDAAVLALTLQWKNICWRDQPDWVMKLILDNSAAGPMP